MEFLGRGGGAGGNFWIFPGGAGGAGGYGFTEFHLAEYLLSWHENYSASLLLEKNFNDIFTVLVNFQLQLLP